MPPCSGQTGTLPMAAIASVRTPAPNSARHGPVPAGPYHAHLLPRPAPRPHEATGISPPSARARGPHPVHARTCRSRDGIVLSFIPMLRFPGGVSIRLERGSRRLSGTRPARGAQVPPRPRCQSGGGAMKEKEAELLTYRLATRGGTSSVCPSRRPPSLERRLRQPGCPSSRARTTCVASARTVRALGFASQPLSWFALIVSSFGARECTYEVALRQTGRARFSA
jgi:hypothetical protein